MAEAFSSSRIFFIEQPNLPNSKTDKNVEKQEVKADTRLFYSVDGLPMYSQIGQAPWVDCLCTHGEIKLLELGGATQNAISHSSRAKVNFYRLFPQTNSDS